jgi:hypothetical protein
MCEGVEYSSAILDLDTEVSVQLHALDALPQGMSLWYPLHKSWVGPGTSLDIVKSLVPVQNQTLPIKPIAILTQLLQLLFLKRSEEVIRELKGTDCITVQPNVWALANALKIQKSIKLDKGHIEVKTSVTAFQLETPGNSIKLCKNPSIRWLLSSRCTLHISWTRVVRQSFA